MSIVFIGLGVFVSGLALFYHLNPKKFIMSAGYTPWRVLSVYYVPPRKKPKKGNKNGYAHIVAFQKAQKHNKKKTARTGA